MHQPDPLSEPERHVTSDPQQAGWREAGDAHDDRSLLGELAGIGVEQDEDEQPLAPSDVEQPLSDNRLTAYEAMQLYHMMVGRTGGPLLNLRSADTQTRPLYDWFVGAINVAPACDMLFGLVLRLAEWKRSTKSSRSRADRDDRDDDKPPWDWSNQPGIRA